MKYVLILGNGFSIDLLGHIRNGDTTPLSNLLCFGDKLPWPQNGKSAFISFRNTPFLWLLGVRPSNGSEKNNRIIENIITCANAYYLKPKEKRNFGDGEKRKAYIAAYKELIIYLKYLFVYLDENYVFNKKDIEEWPWAKFLQKINNDVDIEFIDIITFNYDVWIEKVLTCLGINYSINVFEPVGENKFRITKPHGSISFVHKTRINFDAFNINYHGELLDGASSDFDVLENDFRHNTPIVAMIPPAGDSERFKLTWAGNMRDAAIDIAKNVDRSDKVLLCGISYWHVDRQEIDEILINIPDSTEISYINPEPPETMDAVLTSLFDNYEHFTSVGRYIGENNA